MRAVRSVLVASDLSRNSGGVVRAAAELAHRAGADLHVVHAVEVLGRPFWDARYSLVELQKVIHDARRQLEDQIGQALPPPMSAASVKLEYQPASRAILERARQVRADLIVIGPHRARVPGGYVLGTTAQRVLEEATAPCLVTREPLRLPLRKVLLPVGAEDMRRGLLDVGAQWLMMLRRQLQTWPITVGELRILHVVGSPYDWRDISEELTCATRSIGESEDVSSHFHLHRAVAWNTSPAVEIVRTAERAAVDLIAMGVRGHGPLMRALVGSVSSGVLRRSEGPVLLFPPRMCDRWAVPAGMMVSADAPQWRASDDDGARATKMPVRL